ncbi:MAG TPA: GNAT family N-acetyltransferase [Gillisia sp.]|nr:GNAT family N-acetyltransferase [Gillisia sp.]
MELKIININEDKTKEIYASTDCQQLITSMEKFYPKIGFNKPWVGYFIFKNNQVVGTGGFTGQPKDGKVEIAYWTFKEFEGQGVATFACKELIAISKRADPTIIITAKTAPEYNASTKILQNNGFTFSEIVQDDEIGDAWFWTLKL